MARPGRPVRVGVISDTHGLARPEALRALRRSDFIIHAGDVGNAEVVDRLRGVAPTFVVRGNNDKGTWAAELPPTASIQVGTIRFYVLHEISRLDLDPLAAGFEVVVSGHSHRPSVERRDGILYLNPGSAGPRRFTLPVSIALISVSGRKIRSRLVELDC
ncbi:MAG: metallophosphoesterase [Thermoplasmata archaeon]|nr:metallophosphoesterase [Thermoplasmata archaeon]